MTFFSRPNLDDIQFKQTPDSTLSLSGQTRIKTWSGLTLSDGAGSDIPITVSGASSATTEGFVLTYMNGLVSLQPSSASGGTFQFECGQTPITRFEGDDVKYNVNVSADTINSFLEKFFFPAVAPTASLSIASGGVNREFGDEDTGDLYYEAIRKTNQISSISIDRDSDNDYDRFPDTDSTTECYTGTYTYTFQSSFASPSSGTSETCVTFKNCVEDVCGKSDVACASITWKNKRFIGKSGVLYNDSSVENIFGSGELSTSKSKSLTEDFNNEFFYYAYPSSFGTPSFTVNGLPNNAWGNSDNNTLYKFDYTNSNGYENQYYVARSDSRITGSFSINIS